MYRKSIKAMSIAIAIALAGCNVTVEPLEDPDAENPGNGDVVGPGTGDNGSAGGSSTGGGSTGGNSTGGDSTGGDSTGDGSTTGGDSSGGGSAGEGPDGGNNQDHAFGKTEFGAQCANCHVANDAQLIDGYNLEALATYIEVSMPILDPAACVDECATSIAAYMIHLVETPEVNPYDLNYLPNASTPIDAAPVIISRLNRSEYTNTVRDLLGVDASSMVEFPEDDYGHFFNNLSAVLSVSSLHMEAYDKATKAIVTEALKRSPSPSTRNLVTDGDFSSVNVGNSTFKRFYAPNGFTDWKVVKGYISIDTGVDPKDPERKNKVIDMDPGSEVHQEISVTPGQQYQLRFSYRKNRYAPDDSKAVVSIADLSVPIDVTPASNADWVTVTRNFTAQNRQEILSLEGLEGKFDCCGMIVDKISIQSLADSEEGPVVSCNASQGISCARETAQSFATKAWRRPVSNDEVNRLVALFETSYSGSNAFDTAMETMMRGVLMSPNFLFRPELDVNLNSRTAAPLNAYELASRLSYFIWSSMPDSTLFSKAEDGSILEDDVLREEVKRMLADDKAQALVDNFASQWLQFNKVQSIQLDTEEFPEFTPQLAKDMSEETRLFVNELIQNNAPVSNLLTANFTFINQRLANHYGEPGVRGNQFRKHQWTDPERQGILAQGSFLVGESNPSETSPVKRGKWVLEALLCKAPPPPPADVGDFSDTVGNSDNLTTVEIFEMHRDSSTTCYGCHAIMDPIGFGLESFGPSGKWRTQDAHGPVLPRGTLPSGDSFDGAKELSSTLSEASSLAACTIEHMLSYATGRTMDAYGSIATNQSPKDYPAVLSIYEVTKDNNHRFQDIIENIVLSETFRNRRGANTEESIR